MDEPGTDFADLFSPYLSVCDLGGTLACGVLTTLGTMGSPAMVEPRSQHTATLLSNELVLVAGGIGDATGLPTSSAELFAPRVPPDGRFVTTASMSTARVGHTATVLANGLVLVTGGRDDSGALLSSAELYDPATGLWGAAGALE